MTSVESLFWNALPDWLMITAIIGIGILLFSFVSGIATALHNVFGLFRKETIEKLKWWMFVISSMAFYSFVFGVLARFLAMILIYFSFISTLKHSVLAGFLAMILAYMSILNEEYVSIDLLIGGGMGFIIGLILLLVGDENKMRDTVRVRRVIGDCKYFCVIIGWIIGMITGAVSGWNSDGIIGAIIGMITGVIVGGIIGMITGAIIEGIVYMAHAIFKNKIEFPSNVPPIGNENKTINIDNGRNNIHGVIGMIIGAIIGGIIGQNMIIGYMIIGMIIGGVIGMIIGMIINTIIRGIVYLFHAIFNRILLPHSKFFENLLTKLFAFLTRYEIICNNCLCYSSPLKSRYEDGIRYCECLECNNKLEKTKEKGKVIVAFGNYSVNSGNSAFILKNPDFFNKNKSIDVSEVYIDTQTADELRLMQFIAFIHNHLPKYGVESIKVFYDGNLDDLGANLRNLILTKFKKVIKIKQK